MSALRLFRSEQDAAEDRRAARKERALRQTRCGACGRFAKQGVLLYGGVCRHCVVEDQRPAIRHKVAQAKRWWLTTRRSA